jgi:predicted Zn finger-like uncharacterized protein
MKVSCQACGAKYTIADDKVRGRRVKVRCKSCRAPIVVDGSQPASEAQPAGDGAEPKTEAAPAATPGEVAASTWEVNLSDTEQRRMTLAEITEGWQAGVVTADAYVWQDGFDDWKPILEAPEIGPLLSAAAAAPAAAEAAPGHTPTAPLQTAKGAAFPTPAAATKPQLPAARPVAGAARGGGRPVANADLFSGEPADDAAQVAVSGARNENSVLFSLDALKAGFTPTGQEPAPRRPTPKKSGLDDLMNIGGGGTLLGFDNQALLTAPAPPDPPKPKPVTDSSLMGTSTTTAALPADKKPSKMMLAIGGAVALLALVGIVLAFSGDKKEEVVAERPPAEKAEPKLDEPKAPEPAPAPEAKADDAGAAAADTKPAEDKPAEEKTSDAKPSDSKASKPSTVATKPAPVEDKKPAVAGGPFDTGAAKAALGAAAGQAAGCKKPGGPTGSGKVIVTFAPSGRVTTANVQGGSFGGTPTGGCVASVFRRAKVPPFSGTGVTVSKSFTIK